MKNKIQYHPTARTNRCRRLNKRDSLTTLLFILCQLSITIGFTSCTDNLDPADELTAGIPVELTARVASHVQSRSTADNTWHGGEEVGVQLDGKCYKYIADANGKLTVAPGEEIPRWNVSHHEKTVVAWYPYSDKLPETFIVMKQQKVNKNYYSSDFLLAKETRISLDNPEITFRHLPAKVVVNIKAGDGISDTDMGDLSELQTIIHNQYSDTLHGKTIVSGQINPVDGTVENLPVRAHIDSLYAYSLPHAAPGFVKSFQILLAPQRLTKGIPFLKIFKVQKGWFYYTPQSDDELSLEPGKKYVYNITVMKEGFSVVRYEVSEWDTEVKDVYHRETVNGYRAQDLKPFDYYYSDGTWSDGGYRRFKDGTEAWLDIAPTEGKQVIGIVFQTNKNRMSQAEIKKSWEHGYAVSLTICGSSSYISWNYLQWGPKGNNTSIEQDAVTTFTACKDFIFGYEATQKVINDIGKGSVEALEDTEYKAFYHACQYGKTDNTKQYAAPEKSSGWYLPSVGQWWDITENLLCCKFDASNESAYSEQKKNYAWKYLETQLHWLPGALNFESTYWTSSPYDAENAWCVDISKKNNEISLYKGSKEHELHVRAVIAF